MNTHSPLLKAHDLTSQRGGRQLFEGISFSLAAAQLLQVHGGNGSGKTTLLRILCGLATPTAGEVHFRGHPLLPSSPALHRELHYLGHRDGLKLALTPLQNLRFAAKLVDGSEPPTGSAEAALDRFQLTRHGHRATRELSTGQRRRVALARLLVRQAQLWILDEPFTALDEHGAEILGAVIAEHREAAGAVVLTSHQPLDLAGGDPHRLDLGQ